MLYNCVKYHINVEQYALELIKVFILRPQMYPETREGEQPCLPLGSFLTCSSDNTVRLWNTDAHNASLSRNVISNVSEKRPACLTARCLVSDTFIVG